MNDESAGQGPHDRRVRPLPEWNKDLKHHECALERLVYSQEPAGEQAKEFRLLLALAISEEVAAERERCARLVETQDTNGDHVGGWFELLAAKIRD